LGSAAYEDTVQELAASGLGFHVLVADARVQGAGADLSMVRALHALRGHDCDAVLLVRGGGSRTDLVAFDSERLARAVATMPVPVLAGIGHEIDSSVVDEVAFASYKTPTACAAAIVDRVRAARERAESAWAATMAVATTQLAAATQRIDATSLRVSPARVEASLHAADRLLDRQLERAARAVRATTDARRSRLELLEARAAAADPARLLARGWTLTRTADGRLVRSPADAPPGTELVTTLVDGTLRSTAHD
jgi:exodeoxyribonuclease VII large subunit